MAGFTPNSRCSTTRFPRGSLFRMPVAEPYPAFSTERSKWIAARRGFKNAVDPSRPYAFIREVERGPDGEAWDTATIFLTNRECPWRCVMCDLWKNTTDETVPAGAIAKQIRHALAELRGARQLKLYNSGSFFDRQAIPARDFPEIAKIAREFDRLVVECHPSLVGREVVAFAKLLAKPLEIAMGLETAHPESLERLNKRMTLEDFRAAARRLRSANIALRVFVLVQPPFLPAPESAAWTRRSIDFALECGATVVSLIPTRAGNGAMDDLQRVGLFAEPTLEALEDAHDYGVALQLARVFADLWDLRRFSQCDSCFEARARRIARINMEQRVLPRVACACQE